MLYAGWHNHTDKSNHENRDSIIPVEQLIDIALELGHTGVGITDHGVLSSHVKAIRHLDKLKKDIDKKRINKRLICPMNYLAKVKFEKYKSEESTLEMKHFFNKVKKNDQNKKKTIKKIEELITKYSFKISNERIKYFVEYAKRTLMWIYVQDKRYYFDLRNLVEEVKATEVEYATYSHEHFD